MNDHDQHWNSWIREKNVDKQQTRAVSIGLR